MFVFASLYDDNINPFLHSFSNRLLRSRPEPPVQSPQNGSMISLSPAPYSRVVSRRRRFHDFGFLDLPKAVRNAIYTELFSNNTIQVCSFAKEHDGDFGKDERCQLLMTCRTIATEATGYLYFYTKWKFVSVSALSYFTWPDVHPNRWRNVRKLTLTKINILPEFRRHLDKFGELHKLYIDVPFEFPVELKRRPQNHEHRDFIRSLLKRHDFLVRVHPHIYVEREWEVCMTVHAIYGGGDEEIVLINIDRLQLQHQFYPVPLEDLCYTLELPSIDDAEAELMVVGDRQLRTGDW